MALVRWFEGIWLLMPHSSTAHLTIRLQLSLSNLHNWHAWSAKPYLSNWLHLTWKIPIVTSIANLQFLNALIMSPGDTHSLQEWNVSAGMLIWEWADFVSSMLPCIYSVQAIDNIDKFRQGKFSNSHVRASPVGRALWTMDSTNSTSCLVKLVTLSRATV